MSQEQGVEETQVVESEEKVPAVEQAVETPESLPDSNEEVQETPIENPDELPIEVKERTRRNFERMRKERDEARRLAESLQQPQPFVQTPNLNQQQVAQIKDNFIDEDGNVDVNGLQTALQRANQQAEQANLIAKQAQDEIRRYEQTRQTQEAYQTFPQLDPDSPDYDEDFYKTVRNHLMGEYSENRNVTLTQAAERVSKFYRPVEEVKKEAVKEFKQAQAKREQGPIEKGKGASRDTQVDFEELRRRTMQNDTAAIMARLKNL